MNSSQQGKYSLQYPHTKDQSAEYLRQALPLMSKQSSALDPINYAIWYEYVSGANVALMKAVDAVVTEGKPLNADTAYALYSEYIAHADDANVQRISNGFQDVLTRVSETAKQTGEQADQYGSALKAWGQHLASPEQASVNPDAGYNQILEYTGAMKQSVDGLKDRLNESQAEIEKLREQLLRAREEAMSDSLTGLLNRKGFRQKMMDMFDPDLRRVSDCSLMLIDIDNFKLINDKFGHLFGDKVIRTIGYLIGNNIKGRDLGVRFGGEEFLICLPQTPMDGALKLAEMLRHTIAATRIKRVSKDETLETVTVSIGVAAHRAGETLEDCIERADKALYSAKRDGKNRVISEAA